MCVYLVCGYGACNLNLDFFDTKCFYINLILHCYYKVYATHHFLFLITFHVINQIE